MREENKSDHFLELTFYRKETDNKEVNYIGRLHRRLEDCTWNFLDGPMAKMPHTRCRKPEFNPWSGN